MKYKKGLLVSIIIFSLFSSLFSVNSLGILPNINYTFDDNILFDDTINSYNTSNPLDMKEPYNLKYQSEYTGIYNATYSFTNDLNGSIPNGWTDNSGGICTTEIIQYIDGHNKVLELDVVSANEAWLEQSFNETVSGIVEVWIRTTDVSKRSRVLFLADTDVDSVQIYIDDSKIRIFNGGFINVIDPMINNIWYHIRIAFECSGGGFDGLAPDTFNVYVNNIKTNSDIAFTNVREHLDAIELRAGDGVNTGYQTYIDAIGYSWGLFQELDDFSDDSIGSVPNHWTSNDDSNCYSNITASLNGSSNVLTLNDKDTNGIAEIYRTFNSSITQSIIFDITVSAIATLNNPHIYFKENNINIFALRIGQNELFYYNGISWDTIGVDIIIPNVFNTIRIWFDHINNKAYVYFEGTELDNPYDYLNPITSSIDLLLLNTSISNPSNFSFFIDNIYFNTVNYTIGSNIIPFLNTSQTLMEVNRYEFALNDIHTFNDFDTDDYTNNGWDDVSEAGGTALIEEHADVSYDRIIKCEGSSINDFAGIEKDNIGITGKFINTTFGFYTSVLDGTTNVIEIRVYSSDNQQITGITIYADLTVKYRDDIGFVDTNIDLVLNENIEFNLFINYELDRVFFIYKRDDIVVGNFDFPTIVDNKEGLKKINWKTFNYQNENIRNNIDFIGIYNNGKSQVVKGNDFGIALIDIENIWNRGIHNLFYFIGNGTFHIASTSLYYYYGRSTPPIKETTTYYNENQFVNIYDDSIIHLFTGVVVLTVLGNNFNFSYLNINGVILNDSSNSYNLMFEHSGVDIQESFFYVDSNNKLQFTHISNDTDTEYIQARFNINDSTSTDASISFRSLINNNAKGFFRINYTTTSDFIPFPIVQSTTSIFLTQGNNIRDFLIIITDLDDDNINGLTSGFIDNIKLVFLGNIQISVITLSLIGMIIPLIIILTPTVALRDLYGENFVIPVFLLMSLILTIGQIIPIWLFFLIAISSSLFLIKKNIQRDD